jgi:hypothetical protein
MLTLVALNHYESIGNHSKIYYKLVNYDSSIYK